MATGQAALLNDRLLGGMLGHVPAMSVRDDEPLLRRQAEDDLLNLQRRREPSARARRRMSSLQVIGVTSPTQEKMVEASAAVATAAAAVAAVNVIDRLLLAGQPIKAPAQTNRPGFPRAVVGALSENSKRIIGDHGVQRFEEFKRYQDGWDYGRGKVLSPRSVATFETFLRQIPELAAIEPSLFLTTEGNMQLGWEDGNGNIMEVDFLPDGIEYYIAATNEEGLVRLEALPQLIERIRPMLP